MIISCALWRSTVMPYFARSVAALTSAWNAAGSRAAIDESGGTRRVAASGLGTPFGVSTVTSASPIPRLVMTFSTS